MDKLVSIIVPVYNTSSLLDKSVSSFLRQTYTNIEVLLIDDGSTDNSLQRAREIEKTDKRVRVFHQENAGSGAARNIGISNAEGEYYYFPDSDDEIKENTVSKLVSAMESCDVDLVVCGYSWVNKFRESIKTKTYIPKKFDADYIRNHYDEFMIRDNPYGMYGVMSNKLYKAEIIKNNSLLVPTVRKSQDEIFNMMYLSCIDSVYFIEDILYYYYICPITLKSEKYLDNFFEKIISFKNSQLDIAYSWNKKNNKVLEQICRNFVVNLDIYIQMKFIGSPWYAFGERYRAIDEAIELLEREIPSKAVSPDFRKYKYMLNKNYIRLFLVEFIKNIQIRFAERNLR